MNYMTLEHDAGIPPSSKFEVISGGARPKKGFWSLFSNFMGGKDPDEDNKSMFSALKNNDLQAFRDLFFQEKCDINYTEKGVDILTKAIEVGNRDFYLEILNGIQDYKVNPLGQVKAGGVPISKTDTDADIQLKLVKNHTHAPMRAALQKHDQTAVRALLEKIDPDLMEFVAPMYLVAAEEMAAESKRKGKKADFLRSKRIAGDFRRAYRNATGRHCVVRMDQLRQVAADASR